MVDAVFIVPAIFFFLTFFFLGIQMRREYIWLQHMGGFGAFYDDDEI